LTRLRNLHVPENRRRKLENVTDVLSKSRRLKPFSIWHVRHLAERDLLNLVRELAAFRLIGRAYPVGNELLQLRHVGPAVPAALPSASDPEMDGRINNVRRLPPCKEQVPPALVGGLLACAHDEHRRPIHPPEDDLEADRLQPLAGHDRRGVEVRNVW
jgi:hypothetical protein